MDIIEKVNALLSAGSCCTELKEKAGAYLAAAEGDRKAAAESLIAECEADVCSIDDAYNFFISDRAAAFMGKEQAGMLAAQAVKLKAEGVKTCFCEACTAAQAILDNKELLF